ncbi:MAG TPA: aminopeptidase N [Nocardioides sp.]
MTDTASLAQDEAAARAALIAVDRYDIAVDMTGLLEGDTVRSTSTIAFRCTTPGATTFVDCVADIESATLNGVDLDPATAEGGRLSLTDLAADNVLVVTASQSQTSVGAGILRTVDPTDKLVYVWTSFEPDDARRVWACFDQPDLKAPHRFTVTAPESWTVTSNCPPDSVEPSGDTARVWSFPDTPPLSTYVVVVNAGPFYELRSTRGGYDLGLYGRQSLKQFLDRDAEELFDLTARGLAFFGERFGSPFPQPRYDQVFVPNMGGAMENWGCVTWTDAVLFRSDPSYSQRAMRASVLMHEMAHMWFGDLVTMTWWDDLWLNEAFASWASDWALAGCTEEFSTAWAGFLAGLKREGYRQDMGPGTHPIRGDVRDVAHAMANFDAITYLKGQSVLKQLVAYVGEDAFVEGLRAYFRDHAYGNTRLADLMSAVGTASGRDLSDWTTAWFDRAGTDTLSLVDGRIEASSPDEGEPRPHRIDIGSFRVSDDALEAVGTTPVETAGTSTPVELPEADVHLVNAGDLTFAAVRTDDASLRLLLDRAAQLPDPTSRALVVTMAWDMLVKGELKAADVVDTVTGVLAGERAPAVVEPFLAIALDVAELWAPQHQVPQLLAKVADRAAALADVPEQRQAALRTLAASATSAEHFALLDGPAGDDLDLAWRIAARRAELGEYDEAAIKLLLDADPDPDASVRALAVRASQPDADAKEAVWEAVFVDRSVPVGIMLQNLGRRFWRPTQAELLRPFTTRYLEQVTQLNDGGMLALGSIMKTMFPTAVGDETFLEKARELAAAPDIHPAVRSTLLVGTDTISRILRARA